MGEVVVGRIGVINQIGGETKILRKNLGSGRDEH
jgi:hypothetical protein